MSESAPSLHVHSVYAASLRPRSTRYFLSRIYFHPYLLPRASHILAYLLPSTRILNPPRPNNQAPSRNSNQAAIPSRNSKVVPLPTAPWPRYSNYFHSRKVLFLCALADELLRCKSLRCERSTSSIVLLRHGSGCERRWVNQSQPQSQSQSQKSINLRRSRIRPSRLLVRSGR